MREIKERGNCKTAYDQVGPIVNKETNKKSPVVEHQNGFKNNVQFKVTFVTMI